MNQTRIDIKRLFIVLFFATIAVVIASVTIGQDIYQSGEKSVLTFAIVNFTGYLVVFLFMPVELAFIVYLRSGYDPMILNLVAIATAFASQVVDYLIGYFLSAGIIDRMIGRKRYEKAEDEIRKYGNWALLVTNILPLSSPITSLAAGMLKYRVKESVFYSLIGIVLRYFILTLIFLR